MILSIYKIENLNNNKIYIGCSKDTAQRYKSHLQALASGCHPCDELQADYLHGDKFTFMELHKIEFNNSVEFHASHAMHALEAFYTIKYNADIDGYNKKHVATWRTRKDAESIPPEQVEQYIKNHLKRWKKINATYRPRNGYKVVNHQLRHFATLDPSEEVKIFCATA